MARCLQTRNLQRKTSLIRALIADDEPLARARVERLLSTEEGVEIVAQCGSGTETVSAVREHRPDVLFLDVQMPGGDGFSVLRELDAADTPRAVVFITAFDRHALRAFEAHAVDYLLKPFDPDRFAQAFARVRERLGAGAAPARGASETHAPAPPPADDALRARLRALLEEMDSSAAPAPAPEPGEATAFDHRIVLRLAGGRMVVRRVEELDWAEAEGNYVKLHFGRESHLQRETLAALESRLDPACFARVHRSALVNLDRIRELRPLFHGEHVIVLQGGAEVALGRQYRDDFLARL